MAKMKFICDTDRCIECNGCVTACKNENDDALQWGIQRRRIVTLNDGQKDEVSISIACMHCDDAPCMQVCPADCFNRTEDNIVQHDKDLCIGCGYCLMACPFGAPQFIQHGAFAERGTMDKCTYCSGGPNAEVGSEKERTLYGANRIAEGKLPMCASLCSTKALIAGDLPVIREVMDKRLDMRGDKVALAMHENDQQLKANLGYDAS